MGLALQAIMFSKRPDARKKEFESKVGVLYCSLRRSLVRTALSAVQQDRFKRFKPIDSTSIGNVAAWKGRRSVEPKTMDRPTWCSATFITSEHIKEVQHRLEKIQTSESRMVKPEPRVKSSGQNTEDDRNLALNVCSCLFTKMTSVLTKARERCRRTFFEEIGFLFYNWDNCGIPLDQTKTEFIWNVEGLPVMSADSVPEACEDMGSDDEESGNSTVWDKLLNSNPELTLLACYEVSVRTGGASFKKADNESQSTGLDCSSSDSLRGKLEDRKSVV